MARTPYEAVPYTNGKYTLNPGDPAVAVTRSASNASLISGRYIGLRNGNCVMEVDRVAIKFVHKVTGKEYDCSQEYKELPYPRMDYNGRDPAARDKYNDAVKFRDAAVKERQKDYVYKDFPYVGITTLQLNKIFPGEIKAKDMSL